MELTSSPYLNLSREKCMVGWVVPHLLVGSQHAQIVDLRAVLCRGAAGVCGPDALFRPACVKQTGCSSISMAMGTVLTLASSCILD